MSIVNIWWRAISMTYPKEFEYPEQNPFNPWWVKKLKLFEKKKNVYYLPRTFIISQKRDRTETIPEYLRPKQKIAVEKLLEYNYGMLLSGVGSWKSFMMAALAQIYPWYTLVIAPKTEIAKWLLSKFTELWLDVGMFNSKKFDIDNPPKILIMVQRSVDMYWEMLSLDNIYKQVLIDEIHMFFTKNKIHFFINYKYDRIYWFTWTPELNGFSEEALYRIFNFVSVDSWIWPINPTINLVRYKTECSYQAEDWQELVEAMYWNEDRIASFVSMVADVMKRPDRNMWIVFIDRKDIADWLAFALNKVWVPALSYTWQLSAKKRTEALEHLTKVKWVMIATYQTVWTWFDHPPLDTAFYYMFVKFKAQVKQAVGRILRWASNPEYYDFQDSNLYWQYHERERAYKELRPDSEVKYLNIKQDVNYVKCKLLYSEIVKFKKEKEEDYLLF